MLTLDSVESDLKSYFDQYWSLFFMSGESEATSHEWARSQLIEVSEALFWVAFEKPKKLYTVDRFVISEWLGRIRSGRDFYESKEDLLLLLSFGCRWSPNRICDALKISKSAFYFRLFHAIRLRSAEFRRSSGHLSAECAHYDLQLPEYLLTKLAGGAMPVAVQSCMESHAKGCPRCSTLLDFSMELALVINQTWNQNAPTSVFEEALQNFENARSNPIKKNLWTRVPPWIRRLATASIVAALAYYAFK